MVWEMKKRNNVNIFMRFVCHSLATFLASYSLQNQKNEQILALQLYLKETLSLVSFKDSVKLSSNFTWYIGDWKITYYIEHLLMVSLFSFRRILGVNRSSRLEVFCKKGVLKNFEKFTGKHLHGSLSFDNKVVACKPANLSKKEIR